MAEDGNFPKYFGKVHPKYNSPHRAVVLCGVLGIFFILSGSIKIVALMCSYNQIQSYIIGFWSFLALRKKEPDLKRPWRCPAGTFGAWFSIVCFALLLILAYDPVAIWYNIIWDVIAILYYIIFVRKRPIPQEAIDAEARHSRSYSGRKGQAGQTVQEMENRLLLLRYCRSTAVRNHMGS